MSAPLFSLVIPTYNRAELVAHAVHSVLRQTMDDLEVVVSDNCSEDDTRAVVEDIDDARVRYVRTPRHGPIADSWDFARSQARGKLLMMLSDDDALLPRALERFAEEHRRFAADFLFCNYAEYRDPSFPGRARNTVEWRTFSGGSRLVSRDEFVRPLYDFHPRFVTHPSAFVFARSIADRVAERCGHFFRANGVEFFAWPLAAVFSERIVRIDAPLVIVGRTAKSWGANLVLANPGPEKIEAMIGDNAHDRDWVPLTNFTLCNLMAEGLLLAKRTFPEELAPYPFSEEEYLRRTGTELLKRQRMGVDVADAVAELVGYMERYPALRVEFEAQLAATRRRKDGAGRRLARRLGLGHVRRRVRSVFKPPIVKDGVVIRRFVASGDEHDFRDALACSVYLSRALRPDAAAAERGLARQPSFAR